MKHKSSGMKDIIDRPKDDFRIPISFQVGGKTYTVHTDDELAHNRGKNGETHFAKCKIYLQSATNSHRITQDYINETFCHELVHVLLDESGQEDLSRDEKIVIPMGLILYQILKTMIYDEGDLA